MPDYEQLRNAVRAIRDECSRHNSSCSSCPFSIDYTCCITGIKMIGQYDYKKKPSYWIIPDMKLMAMPKED